MSSNSSIEPQQSDAVTPDQRSDSGSSEVILQTSSFISQSLEDLKREVAQHREEITQLKQKNEPLTEFKSFPKLPPELRLMIWKAYRSTPQVIGVRLHSHYRKQKQFFLAPVAPHAILLRVNCESRDEALKTQTPFQPPLKGIPPIVADISIDTLFFINSIKTQLSGHLQDYFIPDQASIPVSDEGTRELQLPASRKLRKLAIHWSSWKIILVEAISDPVSRSSMRQTLDMRFLATLQLLGIEEFSIAVGDFPESGGDVAFEKPEWAPERLLGQDFIEELHYNQMHPGKALKGWERLELLTQEYFEDVQKKTTG
ncbi:hypothetical protein G7Y89_g4797 [Cudoniella acicularis]|uniref:2EXR domain-containing protein n=1 Tax=Cudoniella acicularis TaxID=354080 RepID=A0A8H4RQ24_9HELO|nr:hypothetical protein G7Y89_g4797 [Cudoniella acicularis]